jgi:hypothetical protein
MDLECYFNFDAVIPTTRFVDVGAKNPFTDIADNRFPIVKTSKVSTPKDGILDGYLKIHLCRKHHIDEPVQNCRMKVPLRLQASETPRSPTTPDAITDGDALVRKTIGIGPQSQVFRTPKDFGLGCRLDHIDSHLFHFCALEIPVPTSPLQ